MRTAQASQFPLVKKPRGSFPGKNPIMAIRKKTTITTTVTHAELNLTSSTSEASKIKNIAKTKETNKIIGSLPPKISVFLSNA